jgi:hypothetical protein
MDRSNLGNARLQGLSKDVLGGDPTGELFDWVNAAYFVSYVSTTWFVISRGVPKRCFQDLIPDTGNRRFETLPSPSLDGLCGRWLGDQFNSNGRV